MIQNISKEQIKLEIHKRGMSLRALATKNGLSERACANALKNPSPQANRAIADCIGKSVHEVWPEWYDENGDRTTTYSSFYQRPIVALDKDRGQRIRLAIGNAPYRDVAKKIGVKGSTFLGYLSGQSIGLDKAVLIAIETKTSLLWIATGEGEMRAKTTPRAHLFFSIKKKLSAIFN